jgi:hypothetical protein
VNLESFPKSVYCVGLDEGGVYVLEYMHLLINANHVHDSMLRKEAVCFLCIYVCFCKYSYACDRMNSAL